MSTILLRCPGCNARIKAPVQLLGQQRSCPGCQTPFLVRFHPPEDAGPVLTDDQLSAGSALGRRAGSPLLSRG
jgi:hypothetical protein